MIERRRMLMGTNIVDDSDYLTFTALEDGTFTLTIPASVNTSYLTSVAYSLDDGVTWVTTNNTSSQITITTPTVAAGSTVKWKGIGTAYSTGTSSYSSFSATGSFSVSGNIMSLLFGDSYRGKKEIYENYAFLLLFRSSNNLTDAGNLLLPATTLTSHCYNGMFNRCTNMTTAPKLPATTLASYCYQNMFIYCSNLTTAPELPATTLATNCYNSMFYNCTKLNSVTCLATDISALGSTVGWLSNVSANGTFTKAAGVTWPTGANGIPNGWTVVEV